MKLKYAFEMVELEDDIMAIPVGEESTELHGIIKLNKEGKMIFEILNNDVTEKDIVDIILSKYETDRDSIETFVHKFITSLKEKNLLIE